MQIRTYWRNTLSEFIRREIDGCENLRDRSRKTSGKFKLDRYRPSEKRAYTDTYKRKGFPFLKVNLGHARGPLPVRSYVLDKGQEIYI